MSGAAHCRCVACLATWIMRFPVCCWFFLAKCFMFYKINTALVLGGRVLGGERLRSVGDLQVGPGRSRRDEH